MYCRVFGCLLLFWLFSRLPLDELTDFYTGKTGGGFSSKDGQQTTQHIRIEPSKTANINNKRQQHKQVKQQRSILVFRWSPKHNDWTSKRTARNTWFAFCFVYFCLFLVLCPWCLGFSWLFMFICFVCLCLDDLGGWYQGHSHLLGHEHSTRGQLPFSVLFLFLSVSLFRSTKTIEHNRIRKRQRLVATHVATASRCVLSFSFVLLLLVALCHIWARWNRFVSVFIGSSFWLAPMIHPCFFFVRFLWLLFCVVLVVLFFCLCRWVRVVFDRRRRKQTPFAWSRSVAPSACGPRRANKRCSCSSNQKTTAKEVRLLPLIAVTVLSCVFVVGCRALSFVVCFVCFCCCSPP